MKRKVVMFLTYLFIGIGLASAQVRTVKGNVTSAEDELPVVGASVVVDGTTVNLQPFLPVLQAKAVKRIRCKTNKFPNKLKPPEPSLFPFLKPQDCSFSDNIRQFYWLYTANADFPEPI